MITTYTEKTDTRPLLIAGVWGIIDNKLVHPNNPAASPVVVFLNDTSDECVHIIGSDQYRHVATPKIFGQRTLGTVLDDSVTGSILIPEVWATQINQYLDSEEVCVGRYANRSRLDRVNVRRLLNYIKKSVAKSLEDVLDGVVNDAKTRNDIYVIVQSFIQNLRSRGAYPHSYDWRVTCDESNNPLDSPELVVDLHLQTLAGEIVRIRWAMPTTTSFRITAP